MSDRDPEYRFQCSPVDIDVVIGVVDVRMPQELLDRFDTSALRDQARGERSPAAVIDPIQRQALSSVPFRQ